jgi:hypothetical protein
MALKDTTASMEKMLTTLGSDLKKAIKGNKAAAQRVRTNSIKFGKLAKDYRKESISEGKKKVKKAAKKVKKTAKKAVKKAKKAVRKKTKR